LTLPLYFIYFFKKNIKKSKKGWQSSQSSQWSCKSLIYINPNDNHLHLENTPSQPTLAAY
jgi:hypothetical protein